MHRFVLACACVLTLLIVPTAAMPAQQQQSADARGRDRWTDSVRRSIESAQERGDRQGLASARVLIDRLLSLHPEDGLLLHYLGYALWREASLHLGSRDISAARALLEEADRALERSAERLPMAETYALHASVLGQLIGTSRNPLTGMRLGPRSSALMERAEELGPHNPRVWLLKGINALHAPRMFGGGADRAEAHLERALRLLPQDSASAPRPSWGWADAYLQMGHVYAQTGRRAEAREAYGKVLAMQPNNHWVSNVLLPALDREPR